MIKNYYIREYGIIRKSEDFKHEPGSFFDNNEIYLPNFEFESLLSFILDNQSLDGNENPPFTIFRRQKHQQIKVKNYVGVIETKTGVSIEVLPKIFFSPTTNTIQETRDIFLKMLRHLKDSPFKTLNTAHLNTKSNFPILEVFIRSFIDECENTFKKGLKFDYLNTEKKLTFLTGKLSVTENIKFNLTKKNKFICKISEFTQNTPQNRIIKSTLLKIITKSKNQSNIKSLTNLISHFDSIDYSKDFVSDLKASRNSNRLFINYKTVLEWCEIFLLEKSFTNFRGESVNVAVLFPMEKIFENYITSLFKKYANGFTVKAQDKTYYLIEKHLDSGKFKLIPDIYLDGESIHDTIIDTKWKLLDETNKLNNYNISSADMYQLFAYGMKYSKEIKPNLILIYPQNSNFSNTLAPFEYYRDDLCLTVIPFDLTNSGELEILKILPLLGVSN